MTGDLLAVPALVAVDDGPGVEEVGRFAGAEEIGKLLAGKTAVTHALYQDPGREARVRGHQVGTADSIDADPAGPERVVATTGDLDTAPSPEPQAVAG